MQDHYNLEQIVSTFWAKVNRTDTCWLWEGSQAFGDYGQFSLYGRRIRAHRFSFFLANGHWPEPEAAHLCHTKLCVRPDHLREATRKENMNNRRCSFICKRGHKMEGDNVYWYSNGTKRRCKTCIPIQTAAWKAKKPL